MSSNIVDVLPALLAELDPPGDFCGAGSVELPVVRLSVEGVGLLGLPIPEAQAEALARVASPAPYGRGPDTVWDPNVRRCGQIGAEQVHIDDPRWARTLDGIVAAAATALGVQDAVTAELYKLLVYRPGDFFSAHRDTEKADGMFATLVVVLPSGYTGGELVVRHAGREVALDTAPVDLGMAYWAAFYADCQHELRPVRSGWRVALVYNLLRVGGGSIAVPDIRPNVTRVAAALRAWEADPDQPPKVVYPLAHQYSQASLSFDALKNEDAAAAEVLVASAKKTGFVLRLAMVSIEESGAAQPTWDDRSWGHGRHYYDEDEEEEDDPSYEVIEILDRSQSLGAWRRPDDTEEPLGSIPYEDDEVAPPGALDDQEPDKDRFYEASGNAGCSFERSYRWAALVLWPASRELEVLHQGGPEASLAVLEGSLENDMPRAQRMAELILAGEAPGGYGWLPLRGRLLHALARLPEPAQLYGFLRDVVCVAGLYGSETDALVAVLPAFSNVVAADLLVRIAHASRDTRPGKLAAVLRGAATSRPGPTFGPAVAAMLETLESASAPTQVSEHSAVLWAGALGDLARAIGACADDALARRFAALVSRVPPLWPVDEVVVRAALNLGGAGNPAWTVAAGTVRSVAVAHLRARVSQPLAPPADATRSIAGLTCKCAHCGSFRAYLLNPSQTTWTLKAAEGYRQHVEQAVRQAHSDVDTRTETRGRPYTLVCTKNQASYEARVRQRAADLALLEKLG